MRVLGVDPGATGAFALFVTETPRELVLHDMPVIRFLKNRRWHQEISEAEIANIVARLAPDVAWIEAVHAMPGQGVSSMFKFGLAVGLVRGVLAGAMVPRNYVTPNEWKGAFRLGRDKQEARRRAIELFPAQADQLARVRDEGRAEAALIALFGAREPV